MNDPQAKKVAPTTIEAFTDGPLIVRGSLQIFDEQGAEIPQTRGTIALCRCGASTIKPFCDGTHKLTGFRAG